MLLRMLIVRKLTGSLLKMKDGDLLSEYVNIIQEKLGSL